MSEGSASPGNATGARSRRRLIIICVALLLLAGCVGFNWLYGWQRQTVSDATAMLSQDQYESAIEKFDLVLFLPLNGEISRQAQEGKSLCLTALNRYQEAIPVLTNLIEGANSNDLGDSNLLMYLQSRANCYLETDEFNAAIEDCTRALELIEDLPEPVQPRIGEAFGSRFFLTRSRAYDALGNEDLSQADFDSAVMLDPSLMR